jgi:alpha-galactosidase
MLIADYDAVLKTTKPKLDELQKQIDALAPEVEEARQEWLKLGKNNKSPEAEAKKAAWEELRKTKVDPLATRKLELLQSIGYQEGKQVRIAAFGEIDGSKRATGIVGPVAPGCGSSSGKLGPEYGFGMALEHGIDAPVLLIKVSWGGIDIDGGFRPPSSQNVGGEAEPPPAPGPKYKELVAQVHAVIGDLSKYHPAYDPAAGHEMAGFFWFQGFNDQFGDKPTRYKEHMANFIRDIRTEFEAPKMPFVIGVIGTASPSKEADYATLSHEEAAAIGKEQTAGHAVAVAQREAAALAEFAGSVVAVESYPYYDYAIWPLYEVWAARFSEWKNAGGDRPYHYLGSARFFSRFGHACGTAMLEMVKE